MCAKRISNIRDSNFDSDTSLKSIKKLSKAEAKAFDNKFNAKAKSIPATDIALDDLPDFGSSDTEDITKTAPKRCDNVSKTPAKVKKTAARIIKYVTDLRSNRNDFKTITHAELAKIDSKEVTYMYELITKEQFQQFGIRLFFDLDAITTDKQLKQLYANLELAQDALGPVSISGYTNTKEFADTYHLTHKPKADKVVSLHICFYKRMITAEILEKLLNPETNDAINTHNIIKESVKQFNLGFLPAIDSSIYKFSDKGQLMRFPCSSKQDTKHNYAQKPTKACCRDINGNKLSWDTCIFTCDGSEEAVTLEALEDAELYSKPCVLKQLQNNYNKFLKSIQEVFNNAEEEDAELIGEDDVETKLLSDIINKIYKDDSSERGDKPLELADDVAGITISAYQHIMDGNVIAKIIYNWFNTDKLGKSWPHHESSYPTRLITKYWGCSENKYKGRTRYAALDALLKLVPACEKDSKKDLRKRINELKDKYSEIELNNLMDNIAEDDSKDDAPVNADKHDDTDIKVIVSASSSDDEDNSEEEDSNNDDDAKTTAKEVAKEVSKTINLHDFKTIQYHSVSEIQHEENLEKRTKLILKSCRYLKELGIIAYWMDKSYEILDIDNTKFKSNILPTLVSGKHVKKVYEQILYCCCITPSEEYCYGFNTLDLYKHHPLEDVKDMSPATKEQHVQLFTQFFNELTEQVEEDNREAVREYLLKTIAVMVQCPGEYEVPIIVLSGDGGTGKTLFSKVLAFLLYIFHTVDFSKRSKQYINSPYTNYEDKLEMHTRKFNSKGAKRFFSAIQELGDYDAKQSIYGLVEQLKRLTDPSKESERKGVDAVTVMNLTQILICTNSNNPLPLSIKDRRYLVVNCNNTYSADKDMKANKEHFAQYYDGFSSPYFIKHIYDYFKNDVDITGYNLLAIPRTNMFIDMCSRNMTTVEKFICNNWNKCFAGLNYDKFKAIIDKDNSLQGSYSSLKNLWQAYLLEFKCKSSKETGDKFVPDESKTNYLEDIHDNYRKMFYVKAKAVPKAVDTGDDEDNAEESVTKLLKKYAKHYELKKARNCAAGYYYIIIAEIFNTDDKETLQKYLKGSDIWSYSGKLFCKSSGKMTARGYKCSEDDFNAL